ncbi:MAG: hypothetical protein M1817_006148 [Caeruleum heppii]|nr:MAG: hypothetical protein M1817_006148 [Caeruleum heppii]
MRSILKKPLASNDVTLASDREGESKRNGHRETALYHARLIQQRKDIERDILNATERLLDLPSASHADPAHPSLSDVSLLEELLRLFRPNDFDELIKERNVDGTCGYVLCPRPRLLQGTDAKFRILRAGDDRKSLKVVPRTKLEQWCSDDCARRAASIRVQLDEEPAWTRADQAPFRLLLANEAKSSHKDPLIAERTESETESKRSAMKTLALERGDISRADPRALLSLPIRERSSESQSNPQGSPKEIDGGDFSDAHLAVKRHISMSSTGTTISTSKEGALGEQDEDCDWDIESIYR